MTKWEVRNGVDKRGRNQEGGGVGENKRNLERWPPMLIKLDADSAINSA